ncbi:MAG: kelch repeat-containing protein, partial [Armatimonadota bacterium]
MHVLMALTLTTLPGCICSAPSYDDLPVLASVEWEEPCARIPYVEPGPSAGISGMAMVQFQGGIILAGGFIPGGDEEGARTSRWVHRYDPETGQWQRLGMMPIRREYVRGMATGDAVYIVGGACQHPGEDPKYRPHADCLKLIPDADSLQIETCGELSVPRSHMAVGAAGPYLVVAGGNEYDLAEGGYSENTLRGTTDVFDTRRPEAGWRAASPIPGAPRGWTASAALDGLLYVFGGLTMQDGQWRSLSEALAYDPAADEWTRLPDTPYDVAGWEATVWRDRYIILVGGVSRSGGPERI